MTVLFGGGEMGAFIPSDSLIVERSNYSGGFDSGFSRCAIEARGISGYAESFEWASGETDIWVCGEFYPAIDVATAPVLTLVNSSGTEVFRICAPLATSTTRLWQMQWNNASVWTNIGSGVSVSSAARQRIDLHLVIGASGAATLYFAGTNRASGTANLSSLTDVAKARVNGDTNQFASQIVGATESTIGWRLTTVPPTAAGATTDFVGGYTEVDEIIYSDADFVNSATASQVELFAHSTAVPAGYRVKAVIVTARAKRGSGGPQNIQLALRSAGTTYFSSTQAVDAGYGAHVAVWETDPATSAAFTASAIASLQFGVKSIA